MPTIGDIVSAIESAKRVGASTLGDLAANPLDALQRMWSGTTATTSGGQLQSFNPRLSSSDPAEAQAAKEALMNLALQGITAYHGSPHTFDKFDISKVGTGEGAQAYGHGMYFAESPGVARAYRDTLAPNEVVTPDGTLSRGDISIRGTPEGQAVSWMDSQNLLNKGSELDSSISELQAGLRHALKSGANNPQWLEDAYYAPLRVLQSWKERGGAQVQKGGSLYKVDIPDEAVAKMLQWDAPLSQQPAIQDALQAMADAKARNDLSWQTTSTRPPHFSFPDYMRGEDAYRYAGSVLNQGTEGTSDALARAGIPGISYLDAGSRSAGQGTRNFVVFDPSIVKILSRE